VAADRIISPANDVMQKEDKFIRSGFPENLVNPQQTNDRHLICIRVQWPLNCGAAWKPG
jgi:hypothetical protein